MALRLPRATIRQTLLTELVNAAISGVPVHDTIADEDDFDEDNSSAYGLYVGRPIKKRTYKAAGASYSHARYDVVYSVRVWFVGVRDADENETIINLLEDLGQQFEYQEFFGVQYDVSDEYSEAAEIYTYEYEFLGFEQAIRVNTN